MNGFAVHLHRDLIYKEDNTHSTLIIFHVTSSKRSAVVYRVSFLNDNYHRSYEVEVLMSRSNVNKKQTIWTLTFESPSFCSRQKQEFYYSHLS